MTSDVQKEIEIVYATNAAKCLGEAWIVKSAPNEQEWPDLVVSFEGGAFGLEVREVYPDEARRGSIKKVTEKQNLSKLYCIAEKYYSLSEIPLRVMVLGTHENEEIILDSLLNLDKKTQDFDRIRLELSRECVLFVTKLPRKYSNYKEWIYINDKVGYVGKLDDDFIQRKINEKSKNLDKYTKNLQDVSLLLVCNPSFNSGKFEYTQTHPINKKGFKEVYFLSNPNLVSKIGS